MSTRLSGSSTQSTGTSWMRRPGALGEHQQLGVEEPAAVLDQRQQRLRPRSARIALKPHWASEKRAPQRSVRRSRL